MIRNCGNSARQFFPKILAMKNWYFVSKIAREICSEKKLFEIVTEIFLRSLEQFI